MIKKFSRPRGTRDFLPEEMLQRRRCEAIKRSVFERFGYREVATPTFEHLELITAKSGEDIVEHLFDFKDKSGRELALRPELTAPVMRFYIAELSRAAKPTKLYYFGNCFRYERPQSGRYREFWQAGVELMGSPNPEAEAEVIAVAVEALKALGLRDFELNIGSVAVLRGILAESGVSDEQQSKIMHAIDKKEEGLLNQLLAESKIQDESKSTLLKVLGLTGEKEKVLKQAKELLAGREKIAQEIERFEAVLRAAENFGVLDYKLNLGIARGLDYYSGVVFEIYAHRLGAQKQICGGGSYSLTEVFGGMPEPACGFAFGFDRVMLALEQEKINLVANEIIKILVVPVGEALIGEAIKASNALRKKYHCEVELMRRKLNKALAYANAEHFSHVVIVGEDELTRGCVLLRDMASGEQKEIKLGELGELRL